MKMNSARMATVLFFFVTSIFQAQDTPNLSSIDLAGSLPGLANFNNKKVVPMITLGIVSKGAVKKIQGKDYWIRPFKAPAGKTMAVLLPSAAEGMMVLNSKYENVTRENGSESGRGERKGRGGCNISGPIVA